MKVHCLLLLGATCLTSPQALANAVNINLNKSEEGLWSVEYLTAQPVSQLQFKRSPDNSRGERWQVPEQFVIVHEADTELIRRLDGTRFTQVKASLTATYTTLDKEYAPFSPYSDGGTLLHSGRFFVCAEQCNSAQNDWSITISAPLADHIIVHGKVHQGEAQWTDSNSGHNVYVGPTKPSHEGEFVSIIDTALPVSLRELMNDALPQFMRFYARYLPAPDIMPQLFASFSPTSDGRYGHQGGVLPSQVFMHWYGHVDESAAKQTLWFFAHEAAHIFQQPHTFSSDASAAWLHEGSAELFASLALSEQESTDSTVQAASSACLSSLEQGMNFHHALAQDSSLMYRCGLLLFDAMHRDLVGQGEDIFALWNAYTAAINEGKTPSEVTFMDVATQHLSAALSLQLTGLLQSDNKNPRELMERVGRNTNRG